MCDLEDGDGGERERQHLSLIRCLSEAVISEEDAAVSGDTATILRSLSETCLARDDDVADGRGVHPMLRDPYLQPALIATNVDDDDDEDDEVEATAVATSSSAAAAAKDFRCNCGCGVALKTSPVDDPDDYEDEGCYLDRRRRRRRSSHSDNSERQKETGAEEGEMGLDSSSDPPSTASSAATTLNAASKNGEKSSSYSSSSASTSSTASGCKDAGGGGSGSGGTGRRSFSSSVDSGRSSDTGTLGGSESDCSVKIVSHSFCDVLGSEVSGEGEQKSEDGDCDDKEAPAATGRERMPEMPTIMSMGGGGNKVAVFVPFSAISEYKNDAARAAERRRQRLKESGGGHHSVTDVFMDNVVICDTQVILRINCTASNDQQEEEEEEEEKNDEGKREEEDTLSNGTSGLGQVAEESKRPEAEFSRRKPLPVSAERMTKLKKSRMSRRMTTTVAVYEMVNAARKCKQDALEEAEDESGEGGESEADLVGSSPLRTIPEGESSHGSRPSSVPRSPSKAPPPRRKDLCKLLGLIECDVTTDATSPEDIKVAQKVAIDNLLTAIKENQRKSEESAEASIENAETSVKVGEAGTLQRPQVAKKDLAKFLGIDDEKVDGPPAPATNLNQKSNPPFPPQPQPQRQKKKSLVNWSQMMKQSMSMRWRPADESPARSPEKKPNATPLPHGLDFELPVQLKRVNEVLDCPPEVSLTPDATTTRSTAKAAHGHRRKNLSKFLGMDDSDSEEMVFIQNRRSGPGKGGEAIGSGGGGADDGGGGGNSLNRSDQGSSIVGIRIVNADDLTFSSKSVEECADRISSSYSSSPSSTISSRDSKQRPSAINGFLRRSANITSQAKPSLRSSSLPHCEERYSSLASSSSNRLAQSREDEIAVVGDDAAGYVDSCGGVETEFSPPPRKNVVFKEYTNFCVEESIALGLPIIPSNGNASSGSTAGNNNQDGTRGRKKKKDAERRSAELVAGHPGTASKQPNHQYFFSSTAASLARGKGGAQGKKANKKNSLEAYLQSSNHDWLLDPPQQEGASLSTPNGTSSIHKGEKPKVARNTVVRGSEPVYLDMFRHQQMVAAVAGHQYHHYHHHNHHRHHSHHNGQQHHAAAAAAFHHHRHHPHPHLPNGALPRYLSCSPKGRVRAVKQRPYQHRQQEQQPHQHHHHQQRRQQQRPEYLDELNKVLQA